MNPATKKALDEFSINTCNTLNGTGIDAVHEILPMIHGLSTLLEMGFRKDENAEPTLGMANPELVAAAFGGIGYLAALAMFHAQDL